MDHGLSENILEKFRAILKQHEEIEEAVLYGSRAKGNYREGSDIDVALKGDRITFSDLRKIELDIDNLNLPYKVDITIFKDIKNEQLLHHIVRAGICIYRKQATKHHS